MPATLFTDLISSLLVQLDRNGAIDADYLVDRLVWGAHAHRQFPAIEGPTVLPAPPNENGQDPSESHTMVVEGEENKARAVVPLKRIFPGHRLYQRHRGARLASDVRTTTLRSAIEAMKFGTTQLPYHLRFPIQNYGKYHQLARRRGHMMEVFFVMYDKTGSRLFTGSDDWLVKIWSTKTGLLVQTLRGHKGPITAMCLDPTNKYLATASEDNSIRVWSLTTYTNVAVLQNAHTKQVVELSWSQAPQVNAIISMAQDGMIKTFEMRPVPPTRQGDIETLMGKDTSLRFRDSAFECNNSACQSGPVSPCGMRALTSCKDGSVRIMALNPLRQLQRIVAHNSNVPVTAWSHSTSRFLTASDDGTAKVFEYLNSEKGWVLVFTLSVLEVQAPGPKPKMYEARWSLNDEYIILVYQRTPHQQNRHVKVFCTRTGRLMGCLEGHTNDVHAMDIHPLDHRIVATAGYDQRIIFWNLETLQPAAEIHLPNFEEEECPITEIAFSPDGTQFAVSDLIGTYTLFGIGPSDSYKGPTEQFFITDYHETTMDLNGYVVDTETQLPPHMTHRTPLCYRGGRLQEIPIVAPPLRDPATEIPLDELLADTERRAKEAMEEELNFTFGEPVVGGAAAVAPQIGLILNIPPVPGVIDNSGVSTRSRVANVSEAVASSPTRPRNAAATAAPRAQSSTTPSNANPGGYSRLRRGESSTNATPTSAAENSARRPRRTASTRGFAALVDESMDAATREAILQIEDEEEEDFFDDAEEYDDDMSISSDGDGGRPLDARQDDLYWSGDENTAGFRSPGERRGNRRGGNNQAMTTVITTRSGRTTTRPVNRMIMEDEEDSDEEYGRARQRAREKARASRAAAAAANAQALSASGVPLVNLATGLPNLDANGLPVKRTRGRPPKASTLLQRAITASQLALSQGQQPALDLTGLSADSGALNCDPYDPLRTNASRAYAGANSSAQRKSKKKKRSEDDDSDSDASVRLSDSESSDVAIESDYEEEFRKQRRSGGSSTNSRKDQSRPKPAKYPAWVTQTMPSAIFCPQLGDEVVFAQPGYAEYAAAFPSFIDDIPAQLPPLSYCTITGLRFLPDPFIHCIVQLTTIAPPAPIPHLVYYERPPERESVPQPMTDRPFVSMQATMTSLLHSGSISSSSSFAPLGLGNSHQALTSLTFSIHYHGGTSQVPDFLILASRFNQGMAQAWYPGKRISAWIADENSAESDAGNYYPGTVLDADLKSPWEALTIVWEDGDALRLSPWEVDVVYPNAPMLPNGALPIGPRIPVFVETILPAAAEALAHNIEQYAKMNEEATYVFMDAVPLALYPTYPDDNPWPIHIRLIIDRLRGGWYRTIASLRRDVECLYSNCVTFNGACTPISLEARKVATAIHQLVESSHLDITLVSKQDARDGGSYANAAVAPATHAGGNRSGIGNVGFAHVGHATPTHASLNGNTSPSSKKNKKRKRNGVGDEEEEDELPSGARRPNKIASPAPEHHLIHSSHMGAERGLEALASASSQYSSAPASRSTSRNPNANYTTSEGYGSSAATPTAGLPRVATRGATTSPAPPVQISSPSSGRPVRASRTKASFKELNEDEDDEEEFGDPIPRRRR